MILLASTLYTASTPAFVQKGKAIYLGNKNNKNVCLMINVYWGTEFLQPMMEEFEKRGFSTTFFVGGQWASKNMDMVDMMKRKGFEIANHGYLHRDHKKLSKEQNLKEIKLTNELLKSYKIEPAKLFAPPSGSIGNAMFSACKDLDMKVIMWTRDTIDWRDHNEDLICKRAIKNISGGDLILMHPTKDTLAALPKILDTIKEKGLTATTVSKTIE